MIKRIWLHDIASFDDEGIVLSDLQKVNFIYGGNGCGKTTLSRALNSYNPRGGYGEHCEVVWDGEPGEVLAYNRDFKERNLQENIPGVFTFSMIGKSGGMTSFGYSIEPTINSINKTLRDIGFTGFSIQPSPTIQNHYQIQRQDGSYVKTSLSEGEMTFITFLYFMQMVKDKIADLSYKVPKVVVIDDPISSLDVDAMYVVVEMIRSLIEQIRQSERQKKPLVLGTHDVEQVIILTHNATFHKMVSDRQRKKGTSYWRLRKKNGVTMATAFGADNPVRGLYEQLWQELREGGEIMSSVTLQNTMRRILEAYFVDIGGYDKKKLFAGDYVEDPVGKLAVRSLAKWFDEGSHGVMDDLCMGSPEGLNEKYMDVFKRLFEAMGHGAHYQMMMRI